MKNKYLPEALNLIVSRRREREAAADVLYRALLDDTSFYVAEKNYRAALLKGADLSAAVKARDKALRALGKTAADVTAAVNCPVCADTGVTGGGYCVCVKNLALELAREQECVSGVSAHGFSDADFTVFTDEAERALMKKVYARMEKYCAVFPDAKFKNTVVRGNVGSGKTYLADCVAGELVGRGFGVFSLSAFALCDRCLKYHTAPIAEKEGYLAPLLDCDLLIIDDLGTEPLLKNVTAEYLYLIINERRLNRGHTLITTNLTKEQILARYGERIYSRLFDKEYGCDIALKNKDLRA